MTVRTVRFEVTGEGLTERARELMREGDWKKALQVLMDGLDGMTYEYAISILEGKAKLTGKNSNIGLEEEDPTVTKQLQDEYNLQYGLNGFLRHDQRMYQAYQVIDNLGYEDAVQLLELPEVISGDRLCPGWLDNPGSVHEKACRVFVLPHRFIEMRAKFYSARPETDKAHLVVNKEGRWVVALFEEVTTGVTPFWREKEEKDPQTAYNSVAAYLPHGGYRQRYGEAAASTPRVVTATPVVVAVNTPALPTEEALEQQAKAFKAECEELRRKISMFADTDTEYGWHTYEFKKPGQATLKLRAPKRALLCYALSTTNARHLTPEYTPFSQSGLKMDNDNPLHTDVWLGCGFDIGPEAYDRNNPTYEAFMDMTFSIQQELLKFEVHVLARGAEVTGRVVYADSEVIDKGSILVVPHAGVEYELQAMKAGAVICEVGGKLAHLVTVCRELEKPILRMPDARQKLKCGQRVTVTPSEGKVEIHSGYLGMPDTM